LGPKADKVLAKIAWGCAIEWFRRREMVKVGDQTRKSYPENWHEIANRIKEKNQWKCERCGHKHEVESDHVLTVLQRVHKRR